jgi:hypothetical protein
MTKRRGFPSDDQPISEPIGRREEDSFGLTAGLLEDLEAAEGDRLPIGELATLLASYRAGDDAAGKTLRHVLRYLPYRAFSAAKTSPRFAAEDFLASIYEDFLVLIARLRKNKITAEKLEGYISADLRHSDTHFAAESGPNIRAPATTNGSRKKKKDALYPDLRRVANGCVEEDVGPDADGNDPGVRLDYLEDPCADLPTYARANVEREKSDHLLDFCETDDERQVVNLKRGHYSFGEIAEMTGLGLREVNRIRKRLFDRHRKYHHKE